MRVLVTGAAGFIGSNLVEALLERGDELLAVDNLVTGKRENLEEFRGRAEVVVEDLRDLEVCRRVCKGAQVVLHQAALGSVPRSVEDPIATNANNVDTTLNLLVAARDAGVRRFVYAASSSAYGDNAAMPKIESMPADPLSPYAVSKLVGELYARVFTRLYGFPTIGLRYFNVFGPRQDADSGYSAVIPRFVAGILRGERCVIFGDGEQRRDFTYVSNVVQANLRAAEAPEPAFGQVFNIGIGSQISVNELFHKIRELLGSDATPEYRPTRPGDVRNSRASIQKARDLLGYEPEVDVYTGLERAIGWYRAALGGRAPSR